MSSYIRHPLKKGWSELRGGFQKAIQTSDYPLQSITHPSCCLLVCFANFLFSWPINSRLQVNRLIRVSCLLIPSCLVRSSWSSRKTHAIEETARNIQSQVCKKRVVRYGKLFTGKALTSEQQRTERNERTLIPISRSVPPELSLDTRLVVLRLLSPRLTMPGRDLAAGVKGACATNNSG